MTRFVSIGECMVELRQTGTDRFARSFAGDAYNTAVYFKRTDPGATVQFVTATGNDVASRDMRGRWKRHGIDAELTYVVRGSLPGLYLIELDKAGERQFLYWRSASAAKQWLRLLAQNGGAERLMGADLVYLSGISLAILSDSDRPGALALLAELRKAGVRLAFCPNVRPALWPEMVTARLAIEEAAKSCNILLASIEDGEMLYESRDPHRLLSHFRSGGADEIVLTRGAEGCVVAVGEEVAELPAPISTVADTSGAGDGFNGAYLAKRLAGESPIEAAAVALAVAGRVVSHAGALVPPKISHPA